MTDGVTRESEERDAIDVEREWNPGGVGNQLGDERDTSDETWNPGGVGNATEDEIVDLDDPDAAEAAGE
jgi:hypothetical protein